MVFIYFEFFHTWLLALAKFAKSLFNMGICDLRNGNTYGRSGKFTDSCRACLNASVDNPPLWNGKEIEITVVFSLNTVKFSFSFFFHLRPVTELTIGRDRRTHCSYLARIDTERREIYAIWLILWMYPLAGLVWQLAVSMLPMMFVAVLLIHLFEWAMYYRLLPHAAMPNWWCIVP